VTPVRYLVQERIDRTIAYQKYYLLGFEDTAGISLVGGPLLARLARDVTWKIRLAYRLNRGSVSGHVGCYLRDGIRFAIDAHDRREVRDPEALAWSDFYFKANLWPGDAYDPKVLPVVNGNGLVDRSKLAVLRSLREAPKQVDVAYVSNVWGGREHSMRVFERLAALDCTKDLLAVFPDGFPPSEDAENMARLREQGIEVTREPVPPRELWRRLARARLVPLRAGKHLCFSWRTIDLLAMGACVVFDALPPPRWPVPLQPGVHVADCGIRRPEDTEAAPDGEYAKVAATIERLLERPEEQQGLALAAAAYFDEHAAPEPVACSILDRLTK
jgi:hypothetical protein